MQLAHADSDGSLFLLVNRAVTGFTGYSTLHGLLCAALAVHVGPECGLDAAETSALLHAALTMNVAVKGLQDTMAAQKLPPTQEQLHEIDRHPAAAVRVLAAAGVDNPIWLGAVDLHHETLSPGLPLAHMAPAERVAKVLQVIDRYTAALSPRGSRAGRNAREATRSVVRVPGTADHDEVGLALLQRLGLFPPGTYVKLASGETAVVLLRGSRTNEPHVASVLNRRDEPVAVPRPLNTGVPEHAVTQGLSGSDMRVRLNEGHMLGLMAVLRANIERGNATP
jgi:HD-GYP domain-containing protein (c-di-GMP phosphodiesterase class II)